ncbi:hypothetical protein EV666_10354 [Camelimonas lactis]|uniref:Uncharacterized protein n=1 Tax=Camelimonas lactis TaxID=659006 RepID=A0A4R2GUS6_9HYPH|nr:hypothetical protein EV666_10354 [Camelimonas lactis]
MQHNRIPLQICHSISIWEPTRHLLRSRITTSLPAAAVPGVI